LTIRSDTDELIEFLNSLLAIDPYAIAALVGAHVACNRELADHPTVQVGGHGSDKFIRPGEFRVGLLGILNGYCGVDVNGVGPICAVFDDEQLVRFERSKSLEA
jgi:hypothetical protein